MTYHQITSEERYIPATLQKQGFNQSEIARELGRHRSTIGRELKRNSARFDGCYRPSKPSSAPRADALVHDVINASRAVICDASTLSFVICGAPNRSAAGCAALSPSATRRSTATSGADQHCLVTVVDRKSGYVVIGKLRARTKEHTNHRTLRLMRRHPRRFKSITADNGTEFHDYAQIELATGTAFYFATPHHSWERGTNENTTGLIRQYVPKGTSMAKLTQQRCNAIARALNNRPRKRLGFKTPQECLNEI